jgi:hypothetical protein
MKKLTSVLLLFLSLNVIGQEVSLICIGETTFHVKGISLSPRNEPIKITFDERKKTIESQLLSPTCKSDMESLVSCKCKFTKDTISCTGMSRFNLKEQPSSLWRFNFELDRVSGKLSGIKQFSNSGSSSEFNHNEYIDYQCTKASASF